VYLFLYCFCVFVILCIFYVYFGEYCLVFVFDDAYVWIFLIIWAIIAVIWHFDGTIGAVAAIWEYRVVRCVWYVCFDVSECYETVSFV